MVYKIKPVLNLSEKENETLFFAAKELQKYLSRVISDEIIVIGADSVCACDGVINIGVGLSDNLPEVPDAKLDDAIYIDIENLTGTISGTNPRSVLIAVYRYLKEKGFKFIRPGVKGEIIPESISLDKVYVCEAADHRHRQLCIEGGVYQEQLLDLIDWLPKIAINEYLIQFKQPSGFFHRWYGYKNPYRPSEKLTDEEVGSIMSEIEREMYKRGIIHQAVGHGWNTEAFGIPMNSFGLSPVEPTAEQTEKIAMVKGERKLYLGRPMFTNACYSREDIREFMINRAVQYCEEHPNIDYLAFWPADCRSNNCECENCKDTRPSDYFTIMLNEIDKRLTEKNIDIKLDFAVYNDTFWKPIKNKLINQDRFLLDFAPVEKSYSTAFDPNEVGKVAPYIRNNSEFPHTGADAIAYLKDWQKDYTGDSYICDYHLMWDHYYDFTQYNSIKTLMGDIKALKDMGLNGMKEFHPQRVFTPTSLGLNAFAETLWNRDTDFDTLCKYVYEAEFGENWEKVKTYLSTLSDLCAVKAIRNEEKLTQSHRDNLEKSKEVLKAFLPTIEEGIKTELSENWQKLKFHNELYAMMIDYMLAYGTGKEVDIREKTIDYVNKNEYRFREVFDGAHFVDIFQYAFTERLEIALKQDEIDFQSLPTDK
ncbi:MAG: DUF4838 domain-containing protein [Ruminococcaceae bacterium]|nr:DUF4838 domain-containing protein [Oscillospiraceae bacterium]